MEELFSSPVLNFEDEQGRAPEYFREGGVARAVYRLVSQPAPTHHKTNAIRLRDLTFLLFFSAQAVGRPRLVGELPLWIRLWLCFFLISFSVSFAPLSLAFLVFFFSLLRPFSGLTTTCGCPFGFVCKKKPT